MLRHLRPEGSTPVIHSDNGLIFQCRRFRPLAVITGCVRGSLHPIRPSEMVSSSASFVDSRGAYGCVTSAASPKLEPP
jgi:hypothetical protein